MTGPDRALISIGGFWRGLRFFFCASRSVSRAHFTGLCLMKMFQEGLPLLENSRRGSHRASKNKTKQNTWVCACTPTHTHTHHPGVPRPLPLLGEKQEQKVTSWAKGSDTESNPFRPELTGSARLEITLSHLRTRLRRTSGLPTSKGLAISPRCLLSQLLMTCQGGGSLWRWNKGWREMEIKSVAGWRATLFCSLQGWPCRA